jgi:GDP-L-fucose synthase
VGYTGGIVYDPSKPDGTPRKLMDVGLINSAGWKASTGLEAGLKVAYAEFAAKHAFAI